MIKSIQKIGLKHIQKTMVQTILNFGIKIMLKFMKVRLILTMIKIM